MQYQNRNTNPADTGATQQSALFNRPTLATLPASHWEDDSTSEARAMLGYDGRNGDDAQDNCLDFDAIGIDWL